MAITTTNTDTDLLAALLEEQAGNDVFRKEIEELRRENDRLRADAADHRTVDTLRAMIADGSLLYYLQGPASQDERREWSERVESVAGWMADYQRQERGGRG